MCTYYIQMLILPAGGVRTLRYGRRKCALVFPDLKVRFNAGRVIEFRAEMIL